MSLALIIYPNTVSQPVDGVVQSNASKTHKLIEADTHDIRGKSFAPQVKVYTKDDTRDAVKAAEIRSFGFHQYVD